MIVVDAILMNSLGIEDCRLLLVGSKLCLKTEDIINLQRAYMAAVATFSNVTLPPKVGDLHLCELSYRWWRLTYKYSVLQVEMRRICVSRSIHDYVLEY